MKKKSLNVLLLFAFLTVIVTTASLAVEDHGYNWIDGMESAIFYEAREDVNTGLDSHSAPYCEWYFSDPYWGNPGEVLFASVCGQWFEPLEPIGVVYTDIPLDLTEIDAPKLTFVGGIHYQGIVGVNLTFLVDSGGVYQIAGTDTVHFDEVGVNSDFKPMEIDLENWAGEKIVFRIIISAFEFEDDEEWQLPNSKHSYVMLREFALLDGDEKVQGFWDWEMDLETGFLSFATLDSLRNGTWSPKPAEPLDETPAFTEPEISEEPNSSTEPSTSPDNSNTPSQSPPPIPDANSSSPESGDDAEGNNSWIWFVIGGIVILAIAAVVLVLVKKKK